MEERDREREEREENEHDWETRRAEEEKGGRVFSVLSQAERGGRMRPTEGDGTPVVPPR